MTEPTDIPESKLARIRALLARAEDERGTTPEERELASQRAAELMAKYAVDQAMLDASRPAGDDPVSHRTITVSNPYVMPKATLLQAVAEHTGCRILLDKGAGVAHIFGRRSDLDRVDFLFTHLLLQAVRLSATARPLHPATSAGRVRSFRASWLYGFAIRIRERMAEGRRAAVREHDAATGSSGAELVLVRRDREVAKVAREAFPNTRKSTVSVGSASGFAAGHAAGGSADLGHGRVGGARTAIGG